jgi:hypothetical protein
MHLQKKRAPSPGIRSALRELDSESESEESGLESAPTMTINTRTALAEVLTRYRILQSCDHNILFKCVD